MDRFRFGDSLRNENKIMVVAQLEPGHANMEESHPLMTDLQVEGGVHVPSGSGSQDNEHPELMGKIKPIPVIEESMVVGMSLHAEEWSKITGAEPGYLTQKGVGS